MCRMISDSVRVCVPVPTSPSAKWACGEFHPHGGGREEAGEEGALCWPDLPQAGRGDHHERGSLCLLALLRAFPAVPVCPEHSLGWTSLPNREGKHRLSG